ncbi:hypothetical protein [Actinomycetospora straminea]|uniref:Uncharacterized protein n=1 Tax=Actinomycetospora straminea TaxID=663607 RepID=A0ABP9ELM0_9PSEU|nr:hypothetical protein [Actinomycetospora straminea]MDD7935099.1 hypothetical protein [Actinomycetospora straminea]
MVVRLLWIPVGAGGHVVRHTSRWWERLAAARAHRAARPLVHGVLEVVVDGSPWVLEMAPAWGGTRAVDRGVVRTGPVGLAVLGRSRWFRYEVRRWRDGVLPDREWALGDPVVVSRDDTTARAVLRHVDEVPALTWGRAVGTTGDMWNSNSLVSWLLVVSGVPTAELRPPGGARAPGWDAGLAVADRSARPVRRTARASTVRAIAPRAR